jgi:hypothetical protein
LTEPALPARPATHDPLHPATRLGRVLQQIASFSTMHAAELEGVAAELEVAGQSELAARLRIYSDLHTQEAGLIIDELADVRSVLDRPAPADPPPSPEASPQSGLTAPSARPDPAASSPKRARWLAEQAEQARQSAEAAQRPRSRRDLFHHPKG